MKDCPVFLLSMVINKDKWTKHFSSRETNIYVDDIMFSSTSAHARKDFVKMMKNEFEMSITRELSYFLSFYIKQLENGNFSISRKICQKSHQEVWNGGSQSS
ncbi:Retrovirus-related Pol polyprotein from transposon TNT 1-94 [Gossypium australe]|uniref:Retrovirus-related Pol polyprotein from transposon TNT 1-94 n=1 Tax=Gossypium australe TaxID=47621 RepID=A0A5B6WVG0_9ROSI|nr:Retrovirus-related Pol polyprotein from transposon TNT 1-94 [Gossypium australe]